MDPLPKVSIVVQTWDPKLKRYLDLTIRSLRNLDYPQELLEIIVVGKPSYMPQYPGVRTVEPGLGDQYFASQGYNYGFAQASKDSKYIWSLNDDVIVTRSSLRSLVHDLADNFAIMNGTSPCDMETAYLLSFSIVKDGLNYVFASRSYLYEELEPFFPELLNAQSNYPQGLIISDKLCMFATLIPRKVYEAIGGFCEEFRGGPDDLDYCNRLLARRGALLTSLSVVIWHFSSVTITSSYPAERWLYNIDLFKRKWGKWPYYVTEERYAAKVAQAEKDRLK